MNQSTNDVFFTSKEDGAWAAWPLHSPANPHYGHWSWVTFHDGAPYFVRVMTETEVSVITKQYMVWGMKVGQGSWALVQGRPGGSGAMTTLCASDPSRSVGV
jgi:hypothetical protein